MPSTRLALLASFVFLTAIPAADDTIVLRGVGEGADKAAALQDALADAVLQAVTTLVDADTRTAKKKAIAEQILAKSATFVTGHEELKSEKTVAGTVKLRVRATIDKSALAAKLAEAGIMAAPAPKDKIDKPMFGKAGTPDDKGKALAETIVKLARERIGDIADNQSDAGVISSILTAAGAKPALPGRDLVWGDTVLTATIKDRKLNIDPKDAVVRAGDIVQMKNAETNPRILNDKLYGIKADDLNAIIVDVQKDGRLWMVAIGLSQRRGVGERGLIVRDLTAGSMTIYRPVPK